MINHKPSIKCQSRSSLPASVALLLGGALSLSSTVQAQETTITLGIGSELGFNDTDGPVQYSQASASSPLYLDYSNPKSSIFTASVHTQNGSANNEFHFAYLYGKDEVKSDPNAPAWSAYPRSYIVPNAPFRVVGNGALIYDNVKKATRVETGLYFEYRSYYTTELVSRSGVTLTAHGGFGFATNYFNANTVYETSGGSSYAETNQTEFAIRAAPLLGTTLQYGFANGHYLKSTLNMNPGGLGYTHVQNDVVKGKDAIVETYDNLAYSGRSGLDSYLTNSNSTSAIAYGTDLFEFTAGRRDFRASSEFKAHMYFELGFKF